MARARPTERSYMRDPSVLLCLLAVLAGLGGFGYWSATAELAQGVTAPGTIIVPDRRRTVQHLEGGIVEDLRIREGQAVAAGELTMVIADAASSARFSQASAERLRLLAQIDRLDAQIAGGALVFMRLDAEDLGEESRAELEANNRQLFEDEAASVAGRRALVDARIARLEAEFAAIAVRRAGKERELETLRAEAEVQREALGDGLGNISRVNEVERLLVVAETDLSRLDEEERVIARSVDEAALERVQVDLDRRAELSAARSTALSELAEVTNELAALTDRMARQSVYAPVDGVVIDLAYTAEGAVVGPGEPIYDLVPSDETFLVDVRFQPQDRDDLAEDRPVNLRLGTLDPITPPEVEGVLDRIAADATFDAQTETYYYRAEVRLTEAALAELRAFDISPGIPVEVFFDKGSPRTPLSYFIEPVAEMLRLGMRS
ncbi:MAG: HlyD family type I secretion periplasmic adaptor subunit [Pseudomonadota bacterium]